MPASPKILMVCPIPEMGQQKAASWNRFIRTPLGLSSIAFAAVMIILVAQELSYQEQGRVSRAGSLGRRGIQEEPRDFSLSRVEQEGVFPAYIREELAVLYRNVAEQHENLEAMKAENEALKTQIHRLSGTRIPRKVAPLTAIELSDLLASPQTRAGGSEAEAARPYVKAGAGDGGVSGAGFPGFVFYKGQDYDGGDLIHYDALEDDLPTLARLCAQTPACKAFNSQGWLKDSLMPRNKWYKWSHLDRKGIFVKEDWIFQIQ